MNPLSMSGLTWLSGPFWPTFCIPLSANAPNHAQVFDIVAIDLGELRIALRAVIAIHRRPVLRLVLGVEQALLVDGDLVGGVLRLRREAEGASSETPAKAAQAKVAIFRTWCRILTSRLALLASASH
jgi:hypothetical protein